MSTPTTGSSTSATAASPVPDPTVRVANTKLSDDEMAATGAGYRPAEEKPYGFYPLLPCPGPYNTDTHQSTLREMHTWIGKGSVVSQYVVPYRKATAPKETVEQAKAALDCAPRQTSDGKPLTVIGELAVPPVGADVQFAVSFQRGDAVDSVLLIAKDDMLVSLEYMGPTQDEGLPVLEQLGKSVAKKLSS
ncbi:hypothetical protein [Actinosynnema sp. NPDC020468]|uniref:hypothetical protein n=1 Tax=Actinosynnema sp. NPDC020468 TaxID=3154488 RepID=UPI0033F9CA37